ncbi:glycosyltransferase family 1 protein [Gracilibacillus timonensis]|uniref:glycosyltransferase family 1 protein n=1 Tax=Gracilibacillus timonensis TaxID=1816696 RepID=UPI000825CB01|nr:glycosyltransferase family 1 protein [Gracilibacillus timonensis]
MKTPKKIKVLHVVGAMNRAGTETMLMNVYRNIDYQKVQFDFISYSQKEAHYDQEIRELGGNVIRLRKTNSSLAIYQVIKKYGPYDVIHAHTLFHCGISMMAARLAGVKIRISHAHTTLDDSEGIIRKLYLKMMRYFITQYSTHLLACSKEAGKYLYGKKLLGDAKYTYFPNVIDYYPYLHKSETQVQQFITQQGFDKYIIIGHIGRFMEAKNHKFLLKIMKEVIKKEPAAKLLLVGDGDLREEIEAVAATEGLSDYICFIGVRDDIPTMLHSMDVFVFPSIYEGLGLVLLEAQASGVPCIVSEAIQPEADLQVDLFTKLSLSDKPSLWADKIIEKAGQKEYNQTKISNGLEYNGYSVKQALAKLMKIYQYEEGGEHGKYIDRYF